MNKKSILGVTSKKPAIIVSYITMLLNTLSSIFLTRVLLRIMGDDEYGLYQMVYSVAHYVMILDMGISTVMIRYISEYRAKGDKQGEENVAGIIAVIAAGAALLITVVCFFIRSKIGAIYTSLSTDEIRVSKAVISVITVQFVLTIYWDYVGGAIRANERFVFTSVLDSVSVILSFVLTFSFAKLGMGCVGIAFANLLVISFKSVIGSFALFARLDFSAKITKWDRLLLKPIAGLMLATLIQSVVGYVNSYVDKTLLGIYCTKRDVTIYSLAATILTMFNTIPGVISGLFQPKVMGMVVNHSTPAELTDLVIRVGRWQFMIIGAVAGAFTLFGRHFITLWTGRDYAFTVWLIVMIILPPNMVPLIQTVCISILNAYNKRLPRSLILLSMTGINIALSILLIKRYGALGAPAGTAISYFLGNCISLNIYYSKVMGLEIRRMFSSIVRRTWQPLVLSIAACAPFLLNRGRLTAGYFLLECIVFCIIYVVTVFLYGMNKEEKGMVTALIKRVMTAVRPAT